MPRHRILASFVGILALSLSSLTYQEYFALAGFRDGYLTEVDRAMQIDAAFLIAASLLIGGALFFASKRKMAYGLMIGYVSTILVFLGIRAYIVTHFTGGGGG